MSVCIRHRFVFAAVVVAGLALSPAAWPQSPGPAERAAGDSIRSLNLQTELPQRQQRKSFPVQIPVEVVWLALIAAAGLILYLLRDSLPFWRRSRDQWDDTSAETQANTTPGPIDALGAADQLSRYGRFVEAMHMLLLQSLAEIRQRLGVQFADSLTSREILSRLRLPEIALSAFADIVARVEFAYFGDRQTSQEDYLSLPQKLRRADLVRAGRRAWLRARSFRAGSSPRSLHA